MNDETTNEPREAWPERFMPMPEPELLPRHPWRRFWAVPLLICATRGAADPTGPVFLLAVIAFLALVVCAGIAVVSLLAALAGHDGRRAKIEAELAVLSCAGVAIAFDIIASVPEVDPC